MTKIVLKSLHILRTSFCTFYSNCALLDVCLCWVLDAELTFEPSSSSLFTGEFVTFICDMREGNDTDWRYKFNRNGRQIVSFIANNSYSLKRTTDLSGDYQCVGRHKASTNFTKESNNVTLSVSGKIANLLSLPSPVAQPWCVTIYITVYVVTQGC